MWLPSTSSQYSEIPGPQEAPDICVHVADDEHDGNFSDKAIQVTIGKEVVDQSCQANMRMKRLMMKSVGTPDR